MQLICIVVEKGNNPIMKANSEKMNTYANVIVLFINNNKKDYSESMLR